MMKKFRASAGRYVNNEYQPPRPSPEHEWIEGEWQIRTPETPPETPPET